MKKNHLHQAASVLQHKYNTLYQRLSKALLQGKLEGGSLITQSTRLQQLQRYERRLQRWGIAVASTAALLLASPAAFAQPTPVGMEFRINSYTTNAQRNPSVAMDSDGDFVITWVSAGQDDSDYGIYGQRYNSSGTAQGSEFRVNTYTTSLQFSPSVAMDSDGDFVVTWTSNGQDGSGFGIYGQRYNAIGIAQGSEFQINTYITSNQYFSSVAMDNDGDFVVTWASNGQDNDVYGIYARRYNNIGLAQGSEFQINIYTTSSQQDPSVAMDSDGDFVVAWTSRYQDGGGSYYSIYGRRYDSMGVAQGSEFQINTYTTNNQRNPSVAMDDEGDFVITWQSYAQDGNTYGIYGRRYNNSGAAQSNEFIINIYTTGYQNNPSVAMDGDGDFVVTWESYGQDGSSFGIYGLHYNSSGVAQGGEFKVNTYTTSSQFNSSFAMDSDGDFVVTWESFQDGGSSDIYGQRYSLNGLTCGINILTNPGFDIPIQPFLGDNVTNCFRFNGWTMTNGPFNIIKTFAGYGAGPDVAADGGQYIDVAYATGTVYQDFTISETTNITFGGYFSSRTGGLWTASIDIFSMPSDTLVASSNTKDITAADIEVWSYLFGNVTLAPGTYRYVANIGDDGNFDAASVVLNEIFLTDPLPIGTTDESCPIIIDGDSQTAQIYDISSDVSITLLPNTHLVAGSDVHLFINPFPMPFANEAPTSNLAIVESRTAETSSPVDQSYPVVYPNPTSQTIEIGLKGWEEIESVEIFDPIGKMVRIYYNPTPTIPLDDLSNGWYILRININGATYVRRVLKQ